MDAPPGESGAEGRKRMALGATALTNVLMLLAVFLLLAQTRTGLVMGVLMLAAAALNAGWLYLTEGDATSILGAGYYLWAGSFLVVGFGLLRARDRGALHPR
jgi:hypothetical protein